MRIEFGFGIGFDRNNEPMDPAAVAVKLKTILIQASRMFGGCNLVRGQGAWINPAGTLVLEDSATVVVDLSANRLSGGEFTQEDTTRINDFASFIRSHLNQAAIHVTRIVATARDIHVADLPSNVL